MEMEGPQRVEGRGRKSSRYRLGPHFPEKLEAGGGYMNGRAAVPGFDGNETTIRSILPNREFRARGAPSIHCFLVGSVLPGEPLEQIKDENFDGRSHGFYCIGARRSTPKKHAAAGQAS
jgi:hypothetical protein